MMDTQKADAGPLPQTPLVSAMMGFQMVRQGAAMISGALPSISPALADMVTRLQDVIPKAAAESAGVLPTGSPGVAAVAGPPPPGIPEMPPLGGPQGGGPPPTM